MVLYTQIKIQDKGACWIVKKACLKRDPDTLRAIIIIQDMNDYEVKLIDFACSKFLKKKKKNSLSGIWKGVGHITLYTLMP